MSERHDIELNRIKLHYARTDGHGTPLVLLHGITGTHDAYLPLIPRLAELAPIYALDLRGHGLSGHGDGYRVGDYGSDIVAFLAEVVRVPAVVAGHSLGGLVAAWTAVNAPRRVRGIFLEDPPMYTATKARMSATGFYTSFRQLRAMLAEHAASGRTLDDLAEQLALSPAGDGRTLLDVRGIEGVRLRARQLHALDLKILDTAIAGVVLDGFNPDEELPRITCPTHLVAGNYSLGGALTDDDTRRIIAKIPRCAYTIFPDVGHDIRRERPDDYVRELGRFLATTVASASREQQVGG